MQRRDRSDGRQAPPDDRSTCNCRVPPPLFGDKLARHEKLHFPSRRPLSVRPRSQWRRRPAGGHRSPAGTGLPRRADRHRAHRAGHRQRFRLPRARPRVGTRPGQRSDRRPAHRRRQAGHARLGGDGRDGARDHGPAAGCAAGLRPGAARRRWRCAGQGGCRLCHARAAVPGFHHRHAESAGSSDPCRTAGGQRRRVCRAPAAAYPPPADHRRPWRRERSAQPPVLPRRQSSRLHLRAPAGQLSRLRLHACQRPGRSSGTGRGADQRGPLGARLHLAHAARCRGPGHGQYVPRRLPLDLA